MLKQKRVVGFGDFESLLSLLLDDNPTTVALAREHVFRCFHEQPDFQKMVPMVRQPHLKEKGFSLLTEYWFQHVRPKFELLLKSGPQFDLEQALWLLATLRDPELKRETIGHDIDTMAFEVDRILAKDYPLPTKPIHVLCEYLFRVRGFKGNELNYNDPDNSFIHRVLERKLGIPISISCVYLLVAWRLNLLTHGVGLPGHFIIGHRVPRGVIHIDPYHGGRFLRKKDCEVLVRRLGFYFKEEYLDPVTNQHILARMVLNLVNVYTEQKDMAKVHWLGELFQLIQK